MTWGGWSGGLLAVTLMLTASTGARDQYEQQPLHRFGPQRQPELQVGCADGTLHHHHHHDNPIQVFKNSLHSRLKRQAEKQRQRRDYIHWYGATNANTYQQPKYVQTYQIHSSLPYFVPIWGNPRRIPIFFPAKPILFNPGYPVRNPPGSKPVTEKPPATDDGSSITIGSRINVNENGEPIWGIVQAEPPASSRPQRPPTPPLLHQPSLADRDGQSANKDVPNFVQQIPTFRPPTTTATAPPPTPPPPTPSGASANSSREEPNRCVWAIISCCSPLSTQVRYNCFEQLGCPGAFWDRNPCSKEVTAAALNAAAKFYEQS